jgi:hypothetical protein
MKKIFKFIVYSFAALFALGVLVVALDDTESSTTTVTTGSINGGETEREELPRSERAPNLELVSYDQGQTQFGSPTITGIVKNNRSRAYSYVQITFNLYDADGHQIGTALDNINGLQPDGTWRFEAAVLNSGASRFTLHELTGW